MTLNALQRARLALDGLSVGDAFGQCFFGAPELVQPRIEQRSVPQPPWFWTDDTAMALSVFEELEERQFVDRDSLARRFAERYRRDDRRGYGGTAHEILGAIAHGGDWREIAQGAFDGRGSMGNGSAMRVAPIGAFFADDLVAVVEQARASAEPTHAHPDGHAGAIAVAVAAAIAWQMGRGAMPRSGVALLRAVRAHVPAGPTASGIERALDVPFTADAATASAELGSGSRVLCADTVPFSLWCAARHLDNFEDALWTTVSGLGDRDTTCAIVGGIVALGAAPPAIPRSFLESREPLDSTLDYLERHAIDVRIGRR